MKPAISVIVPVFNVEPFLKRSLDSLCNQSYSNIEIICINDASTDNSLTILEEYALKDNRITLINLENNKGVSHARNQGLAVAQGEFLSFIDPDDYIDLNFYEVLYQTAKAENMDIVKTEIMRYEFDGTQSTSKLNAQAILNNNRFFFLYEWQTAIYSNKLIQDNKIKFHEDIPTGQDWVFQVQCVLATEKVYFITNSVYYHYIRREESLNSRFLSHTKIESKSKAIGLILHYINQAQLFDYHEEAYIGIHQLFLDHTIDSLVLRANDPKSIETIANLLIDAYISCQRKELFNEKFKHKIFLTSINSNNYSRLIEELNDYKKNNTN